MAEQFPRIEDSHQSFIEEQHLFFVGTAADEGRVNLSPKGMDSLRVMGSNRIVWRNLSGSGNETAAHLKRINRMTLMWCSFEQKPLILRAYGTAKTLHPRDAEFADLNALFPENPGARQIYDMNVEMVQTSCGWAVPLYDHVKDRNILAQWAVAKGQDGIETHWRNKNQHSIDGLPTGIIDDDS